MQPQKFLSTCCEAAIILRKTHDTGGDFLCFQCNQQCKGKRARSHCCMAPVIIPPEKFQLVCSMCEGACELADPNAPTHNQVIGQQIKDIIATITEGKTSQHEGWLKILAILDKEKVTAQEDVIFAIRFSMENKLHHPEQNDVPNAQNAFLHGIDTAMNVLHQIIDEMLPEEEE